MSSRELLICSRWKQRLRTSRRQRLRARATHARRKRWPSRRASRFATMHRSAIFCALRRNAWRPSTVRPGAIMSEKPFSRTEAKKLEQYRDRWSSFGASTGLLDISEKLSAAELKKFDVFREYDDAFLE